MSQPCEYCGEEPCACPFFDLPEEPEDPDNPVCPDHEPDAERGL